MKAPQKVGFRSRSGIRGSLRKKAPTARRPESGNPPTLPSIKAAPLEADSLAQRAFDALCERQKRLKICGAEACHLQFRQHIVRWLLDQALINRLSLHCICLAVHYVDHFCGQFRVASDQVLLLAGCALMVASKLVESVSKVLSVERTLVLLQHEYTREILLNAETNLLSVMDYHMRPVLMLDFLEFFLQQEERFIKGSQPCFTAFSPGKASEFRNRCLRQAEESLFSFDLCRTPPLTVAAEIIAATGDWLGLLGPWRESLRTLFSSKLDPSPVCSAGLAADAAAEATEASPVLPGDIKVAISKPQITLYTFE